MISWLHELLHTLNWCPHGLGLPHLVMDMIAWFGAAVYGIWIFVKGLLNLVELGKNKWYK